MDKYVIASLHPNNHCHIRIFSKNLLLLRNLYTTCDAFMKFKGINQLTFKVRCLHSDFFFFNTWLLISTLRKKMFQVLYWQNYHHCSSTPKQRKCLQNFKLSSRLYAKNWKVTKKSYVFICRAWLFTDCCSWYCFPRDKDSLLFLKVHIMALSGGWASSSLPSLSSKRITA